jgi:hypothetical protein
MLFGLTVATIVSGAILLAGPPGPGGHPRGRGATEGPAPPAVEFERGRNAFARGEYGRALELLRPLVYPDVRLETEGEVVQAHRMLGVASLFEGDDEAAKREFRKLLELRPDYRFDPILDPPRVVDFFNVVLKEEESELAVIEAKRRQREEELAARQRREAERRHAAEAVVMRYEHHSYVVNFVPFGAGQFQNGERRKGWLFLGGEALLAGASVAAFATNFGMFGVAPRRRCTVMEPVDANGLPEPCPPQDQDHTDENLSKNLTRVQVATGGLFFAVAIWGVIDALRHYEGDVLISPTPNGVGATLRF